VSHKDVTVGAHLGGVVDDSGWQLTRPPHCQGWQRDGYDGVVLPLNGSGPVGDEELRLPAVEDCFHAQQPGGQRPDH